MNRSIEDDFLKRLADGRLIEQEEYNQFCHDLPSEDLALAFARRFWKTNETQALIESARLYMHAELSYEAVEVCSRSPKTRELQKILQKALPEIRKDYPGIPMIGKLLDDAFLVINLESGKIIRFPPVFPGTYR